MLGAADAVAAVNALTAAIPAAPITDFIAVEVNFMLNIPLVGSFRLFSPAMIPSGTGQHRTISV